MKKLILILALLASESFGGIRTAFSPMGGNVDNFAILVKTIRMATGDNNANVLDYIFSESGKNQIQTGYIVGTNAPTLKMCYMPMDFTDSPVFIGGNCSGTQGKVPLTLCAPGDSHKIYFSYAGINWTISRGYGVVNIGVWHTVEISNSFIFDGTIVTSLNGWTNNGMIKRGGLCLFYVANWLGGISHSKISYFKLFGDGGAGLNLVPVSANGVCGLFDLQSKSFFTNMESGVISGGSVVTSKFQLTSAQREAWGL